MAEKQTGESYELLSDVLRRKLLRFVSEEKYSGLLPSLEMVNGDLEGTENEEHCLRFAAGNTHEATDEVPALCQILAVWFAPSRWESRPTG